MVLSPSIVFVVFVMGNVRAETAIHDKDICFLFCFLFTCFVSFKLVLSLAKYCPCVNTLMLPIYCYFYYDTVVQLFAPLHAKA